MPVTLRDLGATAPTLPAETQADLDRLRREYVTARAHYLNHASAERLTAYLRAQKAYWARFDEVFPEARL